MKTKETSQSTREQALIWWSNLPFNSNNTDKGKMNYAVKYYGLTRSYLDLTGREIEQIWLKEEGICEDWKNSSKSNQKQFKEFDKDLFIAYINKFNDEDKIKAIETLMMVTETSQCKLSHDGLTYS